MTLPKPKRKLLTGKLPSFRDVSNSLRRKSRKREIKADGERGNQAAEEGESDDSTYGTEMIQDETKEPFSPFEYADEAHSASSVKG